MSATWLVGQNFNWAKRKCYSTTKKISPLGGACKKREREVVLKKEVQSRFPSIFKRATYLKILNTNLSKYISKDLLYKSDLPSI